MMLMQRGCDGGAVQAKEDATELQEKSKEIKARIAEAEKVEKELSEARDAAIVPIGNIVHDSVPVSDDEVCVCVCVCVCACVCAWCVCLYSCVRGWLDMDSPWQ
jgi:hypothetical protein